MDAERTLTRNQRPSGRRQLRWWQLGASLGVPTLALALGCFAQKPSGESAPSAPEAPAEETAPADGTPAPASESLEKKSEEPASGKGVAPQTQGLSPAPPPAAPALRAEPARKARKVPAPVGAAESERAIGSSADDAERDAPALRQRLDRAYRAGSPDCPSARERKKAVCDLAAQICQLTERDPNVASVAEYCAEAKERCSEAERRTIERCPD